MKKTTSQVSRRTLLKGTAAGAVAGTIGGPFVISARAAETLVVNAYGGEFQDVFMKTTIEPFEKKFGVKVIYDDAGAASEDYAKIRASRGAPGFDVAAELTPPEIILGQKEKLLEPLTEKEVPNLKHVWKKSLDVIPNTGIVHTYQYTALIWNKKKIDKPDSWADYWMPGTKYGDKVKGYVINFNPANLAVGLRADHGGEAEGRRRRQSCSRLGCAEGAEALCRHRGDHIGAGGAVFRERAGLDRALLERPRGLLRGQRLSDRHHDPQGRHDRSCQLRRHPGGRQEQEAGV